MLSRPRTLYAVMLFLILLACYSYFRPPLNWATSSRADVVYALVEENTFIIDHYEKNTGDKAFFEGHYYTDKSIGPSLIGLPVYAVYRTIASIPAIRSLLQADTSIPFKDELVNWPNGLYFRWALSLMTFFGTALPSAILGVMLFFFTNRFTTKTVYAFILALAFGLCTIAFPYSMQLFQHQLSSFGLFGGFYCLWTVIYEQKSTKRLWLAGLLFSLAVISEYPVAIFAGLIFLWALIVMPKRATLLRVIIGGIPLIIINVIYNLATFRSVLPLGYEYSIWGSLVNVQGFMGIGLPSLKVAGELLFGTFRGLFLISPFLIFSLPGLVLMWKKQPEQGTTTDTPSPNPSPVVTGEGSNTRHQFSRERSIVPLISLIMLGFLAYGSGYIVWWGGYSVGARLLIPMLPFMVVPIIFVLNQWFNGAVGRIVIGVLIIAGLLNTWAQSILAYGLPPDAPRQLLAQYKDLIEYNRQTIILVGEGKTVNPLIDFAIPALQKGAITYNYGMALGLKGLASLLPLIVWVGLILMAGWLILIREKSHRTMLLANRFTS